MIKPNAIVVADWVPEDCDYLTAEKEYEAEIDKESYEEGTGYEFELIDDNGDEDDPRFCLTEDDAHLKWNGWRIVKWLEEEEK